MSKEILKQALQNRAFSFSDMQKSEEDNSYTFSFSSEEPVERWFGTEILDHSNNANINLKRLNDGGVVLWNHDSKSLPIGKVNRTWLENKKLKASIEFTPLKEAQEIKQLVDSGFIRNVSFGYAIKEFKEVAEDRYLITKWEALEISLVNIPADNTVGIDRALEQKLTPQIEIIKEHKNMTDSNKINIDEIRAQETARINEIIAITKNFSLDDEFSKKAIDSNYSVDAVRKLVLDEQLKHKPVVSLGGSNEELNLNDKEKRSYSLINAIRAHVTNDWSKAGFEREISQTLASKRNMSPQGFLVPTSIALSNTRAWDTTNSASLIAKELLPNEFIEMLRNKCLVLKLGARMLTGLVGNIDIPTQISGVTTYWTNETTDITKSTGSFDLKSMTGGKHLTALTEITRNMLQQSTPDIEQLVRDDLLNAMALALDATALYGTGSANQPRGIANTSGINSIIGGTNGLAINIDHLIDMETAVGVANYEGNLNYLTNPKIFGALKKLKSTTGEYLWRNGSDDGMRGGTPNSINGYPVYKTNQARGTLTKGTGTNLSEIYFGDFSQLIIGEWGVLDILPNALGSTYTKGGIELRVMQTLDMLVRQPKAFSIMTDAIA